MITIFKNKSINQVTKSIIIFTALTTLFITSIFFFTTYQNHQDELIQLEENYIKSQKQLIKTATQKAIRFIAYKHQKATKEISILKLQNELVDTIENMRDIRKGSGYIFIYNFDGINIADPILKHNAGKNLINFKDPNGKLVIKELIDISQQTEGGFVKYVWNKPTTHQLTNKLSYALAYKPWNWMVGSGVYLDDINEVVIQKKKEYKSRILTYITQITLFALVLFISGIMVSRYFTSLIANDINLIKKVLKKVSIGYQPINIKQIHFKEFKKISKDINLMISELKDLTDNLESKVKDRTIKLKESEKFANNLVKSQDKFIKNAIHEINTPLSIIILNIDLFKLKFDNNKYLSKIEAGSKIIHNIYNDLSYMVKKDRVVYEDINIDFSVFLAQRIEFFDEVAVGNNLIISSDIEENIMINFNDTKLQRVIDNSISNAIKYSYEKTTINITLDKQDKKVILKISNQGDTIQEPAKLFKRYYRENKNRGGFGIGLNMIKEIATQHNIKIDIYSKDNLTIFSYSFS